MKALFLFATVVILSFNAHAEANENPCAFNPNYCGRPEGNPPDVANAGDIQLPDLGNIDLGLPDFSASLNEIVVNGSNFNFAPAGEIGGVSGSISGAEMNSPEQEPIVVTARKNCPLVNNAATAMARNLVSQISGVFNIHKNGFAIGNFIEATKGLRDGSGCQIAIDDSVEDQFADIMSSRYGAHYQAGYFPMTLTDAANGAPESNGNFPLPDRNNCPAYVPGCGAQN